MNLQNILNLEIGPPLEYGIGVCMLVSAVCNFTIARAQGRGDLGWEHRSWRARLFLRSGGSFFLVRGVTIFLGHPLVSFWVIFLSLSWTAYWLNEMFEYTQRSRRTCGTNVAIRELLKLPVGSGFQRSYGANATRF